MAEITPQSGTPLYFIWICDVSDDMGHGNRIDEMNKVAEKAITSLKEFNKKLPNLQIFMRTIKFSRGAQWVDNDFIPLMEYEWKTLEIDGGTTDLGAALCKVADVLRFKKDGGIMPEVRSKIPHLILITDGFPTDDWESGLKKLMSTLWGEKSDRIAVALGDAANDETTLTILKQFVGDVRDAGEKIFCASNPTIISQWEWFPGENYGGKRWKEEDEDNSPPLPK